MQPLRLLSSMPTLTAGAASAEPLAGITRRKHLAALIARSRVAALIASVHDAPSGHLCPGPDCLNGECELLHARDLQRPVSIAEHSLVTVQPRRSIAMKFPIPKAGFKDPTVSQNEAKALAADFLQLTDMGRVGSPPVKFAEVVSLVIEMLF